MDEATNPAASEWFVKPLSGARTPYSTGGPKCSPRSLHHQQQHHPTAALPAFAPPKRRAHQEMKKAHSVSGSRPICVRIARIL
jgi:hypothetical protein